MSLFVPLWVIKIRKKMVHIVVKCPFIMFGIGGHTFYLLHVYRPFYKSGRGAPMILPSSCTSCSKKLSIGAFLWGTVCFYIRIGSFRILKEIKISPHMLYRKWFTCRWMKTTEPNSRQVPPCRSTWSMRRIWRNLTPRIAPVAKTCPLEPTTKTTAEAITTMRSEKTPKTLV